MTKSQDSQAGGDFTSVHTIPTFSSLCQKMTPKVGWQDRNLLGTLCILVFRRYPMFDSWLDKTYEIKVRRSFYIIDFFGRTFSADRKKLYLRVCMCKLYSNVCLVFSVLEDELCVYNTIRSSWILAFLVFPVDFSGTLGVLDVLQKDLPNGIAGYLNMRKRKHG